ncbi:MAG: hypothetical protein DMG17_19620 [Acidobacteria bacterium]|nr:MAG: hypothetical protein DMG17_19620 [Acidobacteriota bacterium]
MKNRKTEADDILRAKPHKSAFLADANIDVVREVNFRRRLLSKQGGDPVDSFKQARLVLPHKLGSRGHEAAPRRVRGSRNDGAGNTTKLNQQKGATGPAWNPYGGLRKPALRPYPAQGPGSLPITTSPAMYARTPARMGCRETKSE